MIDLSKVKLPAAIVVAGDLFKIKTDFRLWLTFSKLVSDKNTTLGEFDFLYETKIPDNRVAGFAALFEFYNPPKELPRNIGKGSDEQILDYIKDSELIYAAFYERYGIDLFDEKLRLHWHKFLALFSGLHDTKLNEVMSFRSYDPSDHSTYEKQMSDLKRAWQLPQNLELSPATKKWNSLFEKTEVEK